MREDEESDEVENEEEDEDEERTENGKFMDEADVITSNKIRAYINQHYSSYIKGNTIQYGRASFTIEMLASSSFDTWKWNPDMDLYSIVDYMFNYYCT